ncbi:MAG: double-strand break repair protein AddB [Pseudomonadota bacterium]
MTGPLFDPGTPNLFTMPPGADFLKRLAETLARDSRLADRPDALADALIYVPNRRSARALAFELYQAAGGTPVLQPDIRALGDLETDEPPTGTEEALAGLGPALDPHERLGALARLVIAYYKNRDIALPPASAIAAARELGRLLDQAALSGDVDWSILPDLVAETDLAAHWEDSADFLSIVAEAWPNWLAEKHKLDPFDRRRQVADAVAAVWIDTPPSGPVIIAGSTGATPASRALMDAALALPQGLVVLPGLDREATPDAWTSIRETASHPQFALAGLLDALGKSPTEVAVWPGALESETASARRRLVQEALAPAAETADWIKRLDDLAGDGEASDFARRALDGLSIIETADETEEAMAAALLLRETLETPGLTAALVTPDAGLARRVASLLQRWGVFVAPSGGVPLLRTPAGSFVAIVFDWLLDPGDPVAVAALAKHEFLADRTNISALERLVLRGPRRWRAFTNLRDVLATAAKQDRTLEADVEGAAVLLDRLEAALPPSDMQSDDELSVSDIAEMLLETINQLAPERRAWSGDDGASASKLIEALQSVGTQLGPVTPRAARDMLESLAQQMTVREAGRDHPRLSIRGPLEARLQSADRLILAGLNEGIWPNRPAPDAFLPQRFRADLGLADPEDRLGLAAHDFAQLACAPNTTLIVAARRDDAPAVASRWVWRLQTLAKGALGSEGAEAAFAPPDGHDPRPWIEDLNTPGEIKAAGFATPRPCPPLEARPKRLSVTRIDTLQRDPYSIYAEHVLRLSALDPLDGEVDARKRGTAIHEALEKFEDEGAPKTAGQLLSLLETELLAAGTPDYEIAANRAPRRNTIEAYLEWRAQRLPDVADHRLEKKGAREFEIAGDPFTLSAQADRIELRHDGTLAILDFKTGSPATDKQIAAGLDQQMPLQAMIARAGGFEDTPARPVEELTYVAFRSNFEVRSVGEGSRSPLKEVSIPDLADTAEAGLVQLIGAYRNPSQVFLSAPRVQFVKYEGDYARLARRDEWASETGGGDD